MHLQLRAAGVNNCSSLGKHASDVPLKLANAVEPIAQPAEMAMLLCHRPCIYISDCGLVQYSPA